MQVTNMEIKWQDLIIPNISSVEELLVFLSSPQVNKKKMVGNLKRILHFQVL